MTDKFTDLELQQKGYHFRTVVAILEQQIEVFPENKNDPHYEGKKKIVEGLIEWCDRTLSVMYRLECILKDISTTIEEKEALYEELKQKCKQLIKE